MEEQAESVASKLTDVNMNDVQKAQEDSTGPKYTIVQLFHLKPETGKGSDISLQVDAENSSEVKASSIQAQEPDFGKTTAESQGAVAQAKADNPSGQQSVKTVSFAEDLVDDPVDDPVDDSVAANNSAPAPGKSDRGEDQPEKKNRKKSSGKKRAKAAPVTGFEEFFADPPLTPQEDAENKEVLYAPHLSFIERIETCIQRYRARRKLDSARSNIFTKYLVLGGIDAGMKPFVGGIEKLATAEEKGRAAATDFVGTNNVKYYSPADDMHWVVDFEGIVKGFLSHRAPRVLGLQSQEKIKYCCGIIRNFLNYVVHHGVCPEYTQDLMKARIICDKAEKELWALRKAGRLLPNSFNTACSVLYGGYFKGMYILPDNAWAPTPGMREEFGQHTFGMPDKEALLIIETAIALIGNEEMFRGVANNQIRVIKEERRFFQITEIVRADEKVKASFAAAKDIHGNAGGMKPLGIMRVQYQENPNSEDEDCSDDGMDSDIKDGEAEFWVEDDALEECFVGLKMEARVHETNVGLNYFDTVNGLYCSFYTVLPNEAMEKWREPTLCARGPPTVDNPNARPDAEGPEGDDEDEDERPELGAAEATVEKIQ